MAQAARKRKSAKKASADSGGSSWGMLLIGLISGSILAALILGGQSGHESGFGSGLKAFFSQVLKPSAPVPAKPNEAVAPSPRPKLDFYTVLPRIERIIPDEPTTTTQQAGKRESENEKAWYVLQVASYQNFNEADRLKAQLTINGFDANVQKVTIEEKVYYRVRLGPYESQRKLKNVKQDLGKLGYSGMSLRITDP